MKRDYEMFECNTYGRLRYGDSKSACKEHCGDDKELHFSLDGKRV
jgi:hypothetical protein